MPFGSFCHEKFAYGLPGAPSTFQKIMDATLMELQDVYTLLIWMTFWFSPIPFRNMRGEWKRCFERIQEARFKLSWGKYTFAARKVASATSWGQPVCHQIWVRSQLWRIFRCLGMKYIKSLSGIGCYYGSFIRQFAALSTPLTLLSRKDTSFYWSERQ